MKLTTIGLIIIFCVALLFDIFLGSTSYPKLTLILCGIVVVYEFVSPHIYRSR
jgi:hypothetical protein